MKEISLPSGAVLKIGHTPFEESLALNEAVLEELKSLEFTTQTEMANLYKDLVCVGFSSKKIKHALYICFKRCLYNDMQIDPKNTFDKEETREDYPVVCMEVAKHNILPFVKSRSAAFFQILESLKTSPELKPQTTQS